MMGEKPKICTSAHLIEELRIYVSMKMGQAAWGSHQANIQSNLLKTLGGKRTALPALGTKDKKDKADKTPKNHGKSEPARNDKAAPARRREREGRSRDRS